MRDGRATGRLIIEDDGPGIPTADRKRVFAPSIRQGQRHGTRTALAHRTTEEHGWDLSIGDRPDGMRAMLVLELPLTGEA